MTQLSDSISSADYLALFSLSSVITRESNYDGLLQKILDESRPWMHCEACSIFLPDPQTGDLVISSAQGDAAERMTQFRIPAGQGIVGTAMTEQVTVRVDDVSKDPRFYGKADKNTGFTTRALIASPLLDGDRCIGAIEFINPIDRPSFTDHDEVLIEYFSTLVSAALVRLQSQQVALERAQVQRDLDLAREMQTGLLPTNFPAALANGSLDLFATIKPALEVSGDLYDFFEAPDGRFFFLVGDVSGKGVAAGLFMAVTRTLIRAIARQNLTPVQILEQVNQQLVAENTAFLFVTIILGVYEPGSGVIDYAQGGHNQPIHVDATGIAAYQPPGGQPLAVFENATFAPYTCTLQPGETLLLYSDGVTEAMNVNNDLYSESRLLALMQNANALTARQLADTILDDVADFVGVADQSDDITILALHRRNSEQR